MNERSYGGRLVAWSSVATALIALGFASYFSSSSADSTKDALFSWSFAVSNASLLCFWIAISFAISNGRPELRALRPARIGGGSIVSLGFLAVVGMFAASLIVNVLGGQPAREQKLLSGDWQSGKLAPFIASVLVLTVLTPFTEELFVRGLGFSLFSRFGRVAATTVPALAWALMHGLPAAIFPLFVFGVGLGYLRDRSDSCVPGMVVHGFYNGLAVTLAYTT